MVEASRNEAGTPRGAPSGAQIGVVLNGHREGPLLAQTLQSLVRARVHAAEQGIAIDIHLVLDRADDATRAVAQSFRPMLATLKEVTFGNLGASRQAGLEAARNEWIAFLDGDDLISTNWLLDAHQFAQASAEPKNTVFHTEMFVGFGAEVFFRRAMRTSDPEFDPLCLIADWFFCNNLFAHRSIFERCPIEPYDHEKGLGSEDWHWSCQTTEAGIARDYVPGTTYFYRMKPVAQSLGMLGGVVHKATRLFTREAVLAHPAPVTPGSAESAHWSPAPESPRLRRPAPRWTIAQALSLASIDSQLVEVARLDKNDPLRATTFPPRMHYGVAEFYRRTAPRLSDQPKIALFWGEAQQIGGGYLLPRMIDALRAKYPGQQIVVFSETDSLMAEALAARYAESDVIVLDYTAARGKFAIPEQYLAMLTVRYFLQFEFTLAVNIGAPAFDGVLARFDRAVAHRCGALIEIIPFVTFDRADPSLVRITEAWPSRARFESRTVCLSETLRNYFGGITLHGGGFRFLKPLRTAIKDALRLRWSGDRARMSAAYEAVKFEDILAVPRAAVGDDTEKALGSDLAIVLLADGACPELGAVYEGVVKPNGATLHVITTGAQQNALAARTRGKANRGVTVHPLTSWTASGVLDILSNIESTWLVVLEPGVAITSKFAEDGVELLRRQNGRGAVIPQACVSRQAGQWSLSVVGESQVNPSQEARRSYLNLEPVGAVAVSAVGIGAFQTEVAAHVSASNFASYIASDATREHNLLRADSCLALNLAGRVPESMEWARFLAQPESPRARGAGARP